MKKVFRSMISLVIASTFLGTGVNPVQAQTAAASAGKEEVVYANLDGDGTTTGTYVVNIFKDKDITDYGDYSSVTNMNTMDTISCRDGVITIHNSSDRLYYEGVLDNAQLPWNFKIAYKLNDKEYSAADIAGQSGKLVIKLSVTENKNAKDSFFENYALQVIVRLDTDRCRDIVCEGATQANAGKTKQLTYTIMPGIEKDILISADVADFEMEGLAINGIRLELGIDGTLIDTESLQDKIEQLQGAVTDLKEGADRLKEASEGLDNGASDLSAGINTIKDALEELSSKSVNLTSGSGEFFTALETIRSSLNKIDFSSEGLSQLSNASVQIKDGIYRLTGGLKTMQSSIEAYDLQMSEAGLSDSILSSMNKQAIDALGITDTQRALYSTYLTGGDSGVQAKLGELVRSGDEEAAALYEESAAGNLKAVADYITEAGRLISLESLLKADIAYIKGSSQLIEGFAGVLDKKDGELMTGVLQLQSSYTQFHTGISNLVTTLGDLTVKMNTLKDGISRLTENYSGLNDGISDYTGAVDRIAKGYGQICGGASRLAEAASGLYSGTKKLAEGTGTFADKTSGLDDEVQSEINGVLKEFNGSDYQPVSFVSDKNINITSVQFVIKTAPVKKAEAVPVTASEAKHLNFWQKLLRLFGL